MENETQETNGTAEGTGNSGESGVQPETTPVIESANQAAERIEKATASLKLQNDRTEYLQTRRILGGRAEAGGSTPEAEPVSDEDYAERVLLGEINPLQADGYI